MTDSGISLLPSFVRSEGLVEPRMELRYRGALPPSGAEPPGAAVPRSKVRVPRPPGQRGRDRAAGPDVELDLGLRAPRGCPRDPGSSDGPAPCRQVRAGERLASLETARRALRRGRSAPELVPDGSAPQPAVSRRSAAPGPPRFPTTPHGEGPPPPTPRRAAEGPRSGHTRRGAEMLMGAAVRGSPAATFAEDVLRVFGSNRSLSAGQLSALLSRLGAAPALSAVLPLPHLHHNQVRVPPRGLGCSAARVPARSLRGSSWGGRKGGEEGAKVRGGTAAAVRRGLLRAALEVGSTWRLAWANGP